MQKKVEEFKKLCQPLVDYLNEYGNPHQTIIITQADAELLSGEMATQFELVD